MADGHLRLAGLVTLISAEVLRDGLLTQRAIELGNAAQSSTERWIYRCRDEVEWLDGTRAQKRSYMPASSRWPISTIQIKMPYWQQNSKKVVSSGAAKMSTAAELKDNGFSAEEMRIGTFMAEDLAFGYTALICASCSLHPNAS